MWKTMTRVLTIAVCWFAVLLAFRFASTKYAARAHDEVVRSRKIAPFTMTRIEYGFSSLRDRVTMEYAVFAFRGDGSHSLVRREPSGKEINRTVTDFSRGREFFVNPRAEGIMASDLTGDAFVAWQHQMADCARDNTGESTVILGFTAWKEETVTDGGGDTTRWTMWLAPELNCAPLREEVTKTHGERWYKVTREAISVSLGEPDPGLFATPDYPEMTVRELSDTLLLRTGRAIADDAGLARLDRIHRNRH